VEVLFSRVAIAAVIVFALASLASVFALTYGLVCGVIACLLSWPYWLHQIAIFYWKRFFFALDSLVGRPELMAMFMLIIASCFTIVQLRLWFQERANRNDSVYKSTKLVLVLA